MLKCLVELTVSRSLKDMRSHTLDEVFKDNLYIFIHPLIQGTELET